MNKMIKVMVAAAIVAMGFGTASAVQTSSSTVVKVACVSALSVSIDIPEYNFGNVAPGDVTISASSASVKNDSTGRIEDYTIECATYTANWEIDTDGTPGTDKFSLQALFKNTTPAGGDFAGDDFFNDTVSLQNMQQPAFGTVGYDGDNIAKNGLRALWFRIHAPAETTTQSQQVITVTVTANDAATF
jgi:hypothetical protein